jgi:hypothetical protein
MAGVPKKHAERSKKAFVGYLRGMDNNGVKLRQIRFYPQWQYEAS